LFFQTYFKERTIREVVLKLDKGKCSPRLHNATCDMRNWAVEVLYQTMRYFEEVSGGAKFVIFTSMYIQQNKFVEEIFVIK
jgi:hypothetical protein